jgi:hypothetical protein
MIWLSRIKGSEKVLILSLVNCGYYLALYSIGWEYLNSTWAYFGLAKQESAHDYLKVIMGLLGILPYSYIQVKRQFGGAAVINDILFYILIVPILAITLFIAVEQYLLVDFYVLITVLSFYFSQFIVFRFTRKASGIQSQVGAKKKRTRPSLVVAGIVLLLIYIYIKKDVPISLNFSDIYLQRDLGGSRNILEGYIETLLIGFGSCGLIVYGLDRDGKSGGVLYTLLGLFGYVLVFLFTMQRSVLFYPVMMLGLLYFYKQSLIAGSAFIPITFSLMLVILALFSDDIFINLSIGSGLIFRLLAVPALAFVEYVDVFSNIGFTYWGHIKPLSILALGQVPQKYPELWPGLGYIVASYRNPMGDLSNTNANFIIGDGFASAGGLGIFVMFAIYAVVVVYWQKNSAKSFGRRGIILISAQAGLLLCNGHLFVILFSFGFAIWLLLAKFRLRFK